MGNGGHGPHGPWAIGSGRGAMAAGRGPWPMAHGPWAMGCPSKATAKINETGGYQSSTPPPVSQQMPSELCKCCSTPVKDQDDISSKPKPTKRMHCIHTYKTSLRNKVKPLASDLRNFCNNVSLPPIPLPPTTSVTK